MRIGIDLGGTKISLIALDDAGRELHRSRVATPSDDYTAIITTLRDQVWAAESALGQECSVGVGTPGALSRRTGLLKNANTVCLNGQPLRDDLCKALQREVRMANDANCMALSEATDGAGAGCEVVFGVIIGTGTGGGLVVRGQGLTGPNAIAGEWGHNPLPWPRFDEQPGPECYCGKRGCIETFLSGPGLARDYGGGYTAKQVGAFAEEGVLRAVQCLEHYEDRMARALASVINVVDPDVIVLGGGLSELDRLYREVPPKLAEYVFSDAVDTPLRKAVHGADTGVRGAAWLWPKSNAGGS